MDRGFVSRLDAEVGLQNPVGQFGALGGEVLLLGFESLSQCSYIQKLNDLHSENKISTKGMRSHLDFRVRHLESSSQPAVNF